MDYRLAAVSFLNTVPLIEWFLTDEGRGPALQRALPSRIYPLLASGEAHAGLLPVAVALSRPCDGIICGAGIACRGPVGSVKVFCSGPLSEVTRVQADRGSRSSVALLTILLAEMHGRAVEVVEVEPAPGATPGPDEGLLVIGDRCFEYERALKDSGVEGVEAWDLGQLWHDLTGLPFVFAIWTLAPGFTAEHGREKALMLREQLILARDYGLQNLDRIARRESDQGRLGIGGDAGFQAVRYYFRDYLQFIIGDEELSGIRRFHQLGIKHGVFPDAPFPTVW